MKIKINIAYNALLRVTTRQKDALPSGVLRKINVTKQNNTKFSKISFLIYVNNIYIVYDNLEKVKQICKKTHRTAEKVGFSSSDNKTE